MKAGKILFVDDDPILLKAVKKDLDHYGYHVTTANNGQQAISCLSKNKFDLVLTDLIMDDMNGLDVLKKSKELNPETMVIILTGYADISSAIEAIRHNADDYLIKPCEPEKMHFRIKNCLEKLALQRKVINQASDLAKINLELVQEIAEHRKTLTSLQENERKYRELVENSLQGIIISQNFRFVYSNEAAAKMLKYTVDELLELSQEQVQAMIPPEDIDRVLDRHYSLVQGKTTPFRDEQRGIKKDGTIFWFESYDTLVDYNGKPAVQSFLLDITERKNAEKILKKSENKFRTIFENANDGISLTTIGGTFIDINSKTEEIFGYKAGEVIGKNIADLNIFPSEDMKNTLDTWKDIAADRNVPPIEYQGIRKNGDTIHVEINAKLVELPNAGNGIISILRDVTKRKEAEIILHNHMNHLDEMVQERTANLEDTTTALEVLLSKREKDKTNLENNMLSNLKDLIVPDIDKLQSSKLNQRQQDIVQTLKLNLNDSVSTFSRELSSEFLKLTPMELQISNLIKHGKTTKEIAETANLSYKTIETHRKNIRKKMGITNKGTNLRTFLQAIK